MGLGSTPAPADAAGQEPSEQAGQAGQPGAAAAAAGSQAADAGAAAAAAAGSQAADAGAAAAAAGTAATQAATKASDATPAEEESVVVRARLLATEATEARGRAAEQELWEAERLLYLLPQDDGRNVTQALTVLQQVGWLGGATLLPASRCVLLRHAAFFHPAALHFLSSFPPGRWWPGWRSSLLHPWVWASPAVTSTLPKTRLPARLKWSSRSNRGTGPHALPSPQRGRGAGTAAASAAAAAGAADASWPRSSPSSCCGAMPRRWRGARTCGQPRWELAGNAGLAVGVGFQCLPTRWCCCLWRFGRCPFHSP